MKTCRKCNIPKDLKEFGKRSKEKDGLHYNCKSCNKEIDIQNKDNREIYNKQHYKDNRDIKLSKSKKYNEQNRDIIKIYSQNYENNPINKNKRNKRRRERYKNDISFRITCNLRTYFYNILKNKNISKSNSIIELTGCSINNFINHIESLFQYGMSWDNYGKVWEYDHHLPISSFNITKLEDQQECFYYINIKPRFKTSDIAKLFNSNQIGNRNKLNKILN